MAMEGLEERATRGGYELRCPECGAWHRVLLVIDGWWVLCRECTQRGNFALNLPPTTVNDDSSKR